MTHFGWLFAISVVGVVGSLVVPRFFKKKQPYPDFPMNDRCREGLIYIRKLTDKGILWDRNRALPMCRTATNDSAFVLMDLECRGYIEHCGRLGQGYRITDLGRLALDVGERQRPNPETF